MSCASLVPCQNPQITLVLEHSVPARPRGPRGGVQGPTHTCKKHCPVYHAVGGGGAARPVTRLMAPSGSKLMAPSAFGSKRSKFGFFFNGFLCVCSERARRGGAPPGALKSPTLNQSDGALRHARAAVRPRGRRGHHQRAAARCGARTPTNSGAPRCCLPGRTLCQPSTGRRLCSYNTTFHKAPPQRPSGGV